MAVFTLAEITYLQSQRLGRLATLGDDGSPHVVPVTFRYNSDEDAIDIGGHDFARRKKFRDVRRDGRVSFVVDDVLPPWQPRAIEVRGHAGGSRRGWEDDHGRLRRSDLPDPTFPHRELGPRWGRLRPERSRRPLTLRHGGTGSSVPATVRGPRISGIGAELSQLQRAWHSRWWRRPSVVPRFSQLSTSR